MATKTKTKSSPSPAQLRARRKFAAMAKARAKAARAAKRAAGAVLKRKRPLRSTKRNYTTLGAVRVAGKTYPAGTTFPKQRYIGQQGNRVVRFTTKAEAEMWAKAHANHIGKSVKVKKEELNKNGVTYRGAGAFTVKPVKANPSIKGATRYVVVKGNKKVGAISYRLKTAAQKAARKVGGTVKAVISGATTKRNGFWRERLADKVQGKKLKPLRQVAREKIAEKIRGKRNAETRDAQHPIHVRQYWQGRKGYKTPWQRAHEAGQKQLFAMNGKKRNGTTAAKAAYKEFTGKPSRKVSTLYAPKGSGARGTLAAMGKLKKLHIKGRKPLDFKGGANAPTLARDPRTNQMFVLGKNYKLSLPRRNPTGMEDLGEITRLEYEAQKVHLGDRQTVTYFHRMGEEGGEKPHCLVNSEGLIVISGGDYRITERGIEN